MPQQNRLDGLTSWRADWKGLKVAVLGLGVTGFSVADTLTELGADVLVLASNAADERAQLIPVIGARLVQASLDEVPPELAEQRPDVIVVIKSTVPVGFTEVQRSHYPGARILFSPEFLREGHALEDNRYPSRVVVGDDESQRVGGGHACMEAPPGPRCDRGGYLS